jgi:hypothetical protein
MSPIPTVRFAMSVGTISKVDTGKAFPSQEAEAKLRTSLAELIKANAALYDTKLPSDLPSLYAATTQIASLDVVDILCEVDGIVGIKLKASIVKAGGYESINEAIDHVLPRIKAAWEKHNNKGSKK